MRLSDAADMARELMALHGVEGFQFRWSESKIRYGETYESGGVKEIRLSHLATTVRNEDNVRNTILHEIAHALVGVEHQHDEVWAAKARELGVRYTNDTAALVAMAAHKR